MMRSTVKILTKPLEEPKRKMHKLRKVARRQQQIESLAITERNLFDKGAPSSSNFEQKTPPIKRSNIGKVDVNTLTMEQYFALTRKNQAPGVVKPEIKGNVNFETKSQFMRELREDMFPGNKNDDPREHIKRILDIVGLFNISRVSHDAMVLHVFSITLTGLAKSPGRDMKKLKENVHSIQVGCETCEGAHLDKDFPLCEEVKSVEEVKYGEFGRSSPNYGENRYRIGPPSGEIKPSLTEIINKYIEESAKKQAERDERLRKFHKNIKENQKSHDEIIRNLKTKVKDLTSRRTSHWGQVRGMQGNLHGRWITTLCTLLLLA
ncbi:hypothetical protein Tco_0351683 [Tanacetum coccineum]